MAGIASASRAEGALRDSAAGRTGLGAGALGALRRPLSTVGSGIGTSLLYGPASEEKVVLDIGSFTLRAGFSGDRAPLHRAPLYSDFTTVGPAGRLSGRTAGLFGCTAAEMDEDVLDALLVEQIREAYRTHLLVDPKTRKVAVVESVLLPVQIKRAVARVLLGNLRVPQISFYPSSVAGLMTCGAMAGLVVDCGHRSTTVVPVYDCRPLNTYVVSTPMGGGMMLRNLCELVKQFATFQPFDHALGEQPVDDQMLDNTTCARLLHGSCSVSPHPVPASELAKSPGGLGVGVAGPRIVEWFVSNCAAADPTVRLTIDSPKHGRGALQIPAWILERAAEPLLAGDPVEDHMGLVDAVVQCIERAPVDTRRQLVGRILVVGGVADVPNFATRLLADLTTRLRQHPKWNALASCVAAAGAPAGQSESVFRPSERPWIGVSLAVAAKIGGVDVKRDEFDGSSLPDWTRSAAA